MWMEDFMGGPQTQIGPTRSPDAKKPAQGGLSLRLALGKPKQTLVLVAWGGIEPPTRGFSIRCSTN